MSPVSILKPLKGVDEGIKENLESFFNLQYPQYELLFSVEDPQDQACAIVEELMKRHSNVSARLIVGGVDAGPNPKVNNLIRTYDLAQHNLILISDSNTRVYSDFLTKLVTHMKSGVGVVTATVAGRGAQTWGGRLECAYLNTFYARWMFVAAKCRKPCVVGKVMLFGRSTAERFGGIRTLARYLAEDYMTGVAVGKLGLAVVIMSDPIHQHVGRYSFRDFWDRHVRWGRIRKSQAPVAFLFEPLFGSIFSGVLGTWAVASTFSLNPSVFFLSHIALWSLCDLVLIKKLGGELKPSAIGAWLLRELVAPVLWTYTAAGNTVKWRGRILELKSGGLLEEAYGELV